MELNHEEVTAPPRPAATVIMLRDAAQGLEVFLLKRHGLSDVLGGAYVFPGGKLDANDAQLDPHAHLDEPPHALHSALGEPDIDPQTAAGLYVAALREAFEESGILFALDAVGAPVAPSRAAALLREGHAFDEVLAQLGLRLLTSRLLPWSRWITPRIPSVSSKRFDTRFFVAMVPPDQTAAHDNREATESVWLQPRAALEQYRDRKIELAPPQIMTLAHLSRLADVRSVLAEARRRKPPVIQPEPFQFEGVRTICYPGDERHPVPTRAMPGPTRLQFREGHFDPPGGFETLFR